MESSSTRPEESIWIAVRRPLLVAFILGCTVSLLTSGRLTPRLVLPAALYWTFVPLLELAGLWLVTRRRVAMVSRRQAIDLFFRGHAPWLWWMFVMAAMWALFPPRAVYEGPRVLWWNLSAVAAIVWSLWLDHRYLRKVWGMNLRSIAGSLGVMRVVSWLFGMAWFLGPAGWQTLLTRLGWQ